MPQVLVPHDDGRWWPSTLLAQYGGSTDATELFPNQSGQTSLTVH
jgi:hypothetical protein